MKAPRQTHISMNTYTKEKEEKIPVITVPHALTFPGLLKKEFSFCKQKMEVKQKLPRYHW